MSGTLHNTVGSGILPYQQEIRIKLTSNEPIKDSEWSITGYLTLTLQNAVGRTNNATEKTWLLLVILIQEIISSLLSLVIK